MARQQVLVSWIGHADLNAWADANPKAAEILKRPSVDSILREERFLRRPVNGVGPLKMAAQAKQFDVFHLLSRLPSEVDGEFAKWLGVKYKLHPVKRTDPTDISFVYGEANRLLRTLAEDEKNQLNLFLTSGTWAMSAVWVLLGNTLYRATLWQAFEEKLFRKELPFDLALFERQVMHRMNFALLVGEESLPPSFERIIGSSDAIMNAKRLSAVASRYDVCVLLLGAPGTGKELFAEAIHKSSPRSTGPFERVNCAGIPDQLLESELFGHKKGSFTGASQDKSGRFELADKGTLFLDEVGECSPNMQSKLLRVLQPTTENICLREFRPVGEEKDRRADVRIIAATNRNLRAMVADGTFRADLYFRLRDMAIRLPSLSERQEDIRGIAIDELPRIRRTLRLEGEKRAMRLSEDALQFAQTWNWVGNVRELKSVLRQAAMFSEGDEIRRSDLEMAALDVDEIAGSVGEFVFGGSVPVTKYMEVIRKRLFREALKRAKNRSDAAKLLGVTPAAVNKFVRKQEEA